MSATDGLLTERAALAGRGRRPLPPRCNRHVRRFIALPALLLYGCSGATDPPTTPVGPEKSVTAIVVSGPSSLNTDDRGSFTASATMTDGTAQDVTSASTWSSSNTAAAVVNGNTVTGRGGGVSEISAVYQNVRGSRTVQVYGAQFVVTPEAGTNANVDQCPIEIGGGLLSFRLRCRFDATASILPAGITSYTWVIPVSQANEPGGETRTVTTAILDNVTLGCGVGTFAKDGSGNPRQRGVVLDRTVRLTINGPGGTVKPLERTVTFRIDSVC